MRAAVALLVLVAAQVTGCSTPTASHALVAKGDSESAVCGPSATSSRFTVGLQPFLNQGPAPVTVTAVRWTNLVGLSEIQYRVVHPDHPQEGIGIVHGSPPDGKPSDNSVKLWAKSVALLGAELPTAEADNPLQVLIGFTGTNGSAGPLEIDYTDADGHPGTVVSLLTRVEVKPVC